MQHKHLAGRCCALHTSLLLAPCLWLAPATAGSTTKVSVTPAGAEIMDSCSLPSISRDGRFVAYSSRSEEVVAGAGVTFNVFVRDLRTATTTLESRSSSGMVGNDDSGADVYVMQQVAPALSSDGRFVAFMSRADNLVPDDTNDCSDVFVRDRLLGTTARVSVATDGEQANGPSLACVLSGDGRYVVFQSVASNLTPNDSGEFADVFRHDCWTGETIRVSTSSNDGEADFDSGGFNDAFDFHAGFATSDDGRWIAFESTAFNIVPGTTNEFGHIYLRDCASATTTLISQSASGVESDRHNQRPVMSADGRYIAFQSTSAVFVPGDTNNTWDVYVSDRLTGEVRRASLSSSGMESRGSCLGPSMSADGRFVGFVNELNDLVRGDLNVTTDAFVHDLLTGTTTLESRNSAGVQGHGYSSMPSLSGDGRRCAFASTSTNVVHGDTHGNTDIFLRLR